jgi:hypothetical protein
MAPLSNWFHYDDSFDGAIGLAATQKLVEQDKVFALVGHFGTNTVAATVDYNQRSRHSDGLCATGISDLYQEAAEGFNKAVMPVQPIYNSEGRMMLARALADDAVSGLNRQPKSALFQTTDDAAKACSTAFRNKLNSSLSPPKKTSSMSPPGRTRHEPTPHRSTL